MADIIIIAALVIAAFFIIRGRIRLLRRGRCGRGCPGCSQTCSTKDEKQCK